MSTHYPTPQELGIKTPFYLSTKDYEMGFLHALKGKPLNAHGEPVHNWSFTSGFKMGAIVLHDWG